MAAAPPSARKADKGYAEAALMASVMSRTPNAMASTHARASCAFPVPRVMPVMMPRAAGSHQGLPRPVSAGTNVTPPLSVTDSARGPISSALWISPSPSRSHWTAAPETNVDPSSA